MGLYRAAARPVLFSLSPEAAHKVVGLALRSPLPWDLIGRRIRSPIPHTYLSGIRLSNPIGLAAGFDKDAEMLSGLAKLGFGYVVVGTITRRFRRGGSKPRIVRRPDEQAIVNSMGLPNDGADEVARRLRQYRKPMPVLVSLADEEPRDVVADMELFDPICAGFELNVSSPNSPWRHARVDNPDYLSTVLRAMGERRHRPLFVKLPPFEPPDSKEALDLARRAMDGGADGLTCSNTMPVLEPRLAKGRGGLSGRPLSGLTPRIVEDVRRVIGDGPSINACGGVFTMSDARRCFDAGATTVQIYTGFIYGGPRILRELISGTSWA